MDSNERPKSVVDSILETIFDDMAQDEDISQIVVGLREQILADAPFNEASLKSVICPESK